MTLADLLSFAGTAKDFLGSVLNRCQASTCDAKNLSAGGVCVLCGHFVCNRHGFVPLSAIPMMVQERRPMVVCSDCVVLQNRPEGPGR